MKRLIGKRAFITGAGRGIGGAGALAFAREGATVACADIDRGLAEQIANQIRSEGGNAIAVHCDVSQESSVQDGIDKTVLAFGGLDVAWANAGAPSEGKATEIGVDQWQRAITINLTGSWFTAKYALPHLINSGRGSLIFTGSACSIRGVRSTFAYAVAKGGVNAMARQIAIDYAALGVRSNVILPGSTLTQMVKDTYAKRSEQANVPAEKLMEEMTAGYPLRRFGTPEDQANAAVFFASDESGWMTGHLLPVDGGRFASW